MPPYNGLRAIPNLNGKLRESSDLERNISVDSQQPVELLSSSHGKIESLLVIIPIPYLKESQPPYASYIDIIKEFAVQFSGRQLVLLIETLKIEVNKCEQNKIDALKDSFQDLDLQIMTTVQQTKPSLSPWAQDTFLVAKPSETSTFGIIIYPSEYPRENRSNDGSIAKEVAVRQTAGYTSCTFPTPIEGGNILVAEDIILVGQDEILRSGYREAEFTQLFSDFFGTKKKLINVRCEPKPFKPIFEKDLEKHRQLTSTSGDTVMIGEHQHNIYEWRGKAQPIFHIDLFITLLGHNSAGEQIILVGEPIAGFNDHLLNKGEQRILNDQIEDATERINKCIKNLKDDLDQYNISYHIIRNQLPLTYYTHNKLTYWYWASYNNCLVEIWDEGKNIWLPSYYSNEDLENPHWKQLQEFDKKSEEIFRQNGFDPHLFNHDFHALAANNGALHCMTKCLKRSNHFRESQSTISMSKIELELKNNSGGTYRLLVTENDKKTEFPIENNGSQRTENFKFVRLKMHGNGILEKLDKKPLPNFLTSSKILLRDKKVVYIEGIRTHKIGDDTVVSIIAEDNYRQRDGQELFNFNLNGVWVTLYVVKDGEEYYLIVETSRK